MNRKRTNKMMATKRLVQNSTDKDSLQRDLDRYQKALENRDYRDRELHIAEMNMIKDVLDSFE